MIPFYGSATELIRLLATVLVALTPFANVQPLDASPTHHILSDQRVQSPTRFELVCVPLHLPVKSILSIPRFASAVQRGLEAAKQELYSISYGGQIRAPSHQRSVRGPRSLHRLSL